MQDDLTAPRPCRETLGGVAAAAGESAMLLAPSVQPKRPPRFRAQYTDADREDAAQIIQGAWHCANARREFQRQAQKEKREAVIVEDWNFEVDGKRFLFAESSLCCMSPKNKLRQFVASIACHPVFDGFILVRRARPRSRARPPRRPRASRPSRARVASRRVASRSCASSPTRS